MRTTANVTRIKTFCTPKLLKTIPQNANSSPQPSAVAEKKNKILLRSIFYNTQRINNLFIFIINVLSIYMRMRTGF